jgi:hypothetical protein
MGENDHWRVATDVQTRLLFWAWSRKIRWYNDRVA